jgi:hypothetical protein
MYMRFEVVQTTCCLRVVHALSGKKICSLLFFMEHSPSATRSPRGYSRQPPPCSPLPPTALPAAGRCGRTRAGCQIPLVSLFNFPHSLSIPPWIHVRPPSPTATRRMHDRLRGRARAVRLAGSAPFSSMSMYPSEGNMPRSREACTAATDK